MRNIFLSSLLCLLFASIVSCKKDPKSDKLEVVEEVVDSTDVAEEVVEEKKPVVKKKKKKKKKPKTDIVPPGAPSFENTAARKYVRDYEAYVANYKKAVEAKADMDAFLKLSEASSSLTKQYRTLISTLSGDEIEKMSKYIQKKSQQIDALNKQM
ncbi:hypothetical protein [Aquimarina sp. 2201CG14-23]|uniref:hypothetical protein n=1 Tax=Aquimarina mycalae TaxID=3040073 RepID=UPI002477DA0B|nr:hypothetical protein [Aquimarina sp. 2201CG14-23]MDH7446656.1 hypothetical protein [Aquimarina sp. 2201CG14-23]